MAEKKSITMIKSTDNGAKLLSDGTVVTPIARAAWVHLGTPRAKNPDDKDNANAKKYHQITLLFKRKEDLSILNIAAARCKKEKWGDKTPPRYTNGIKPQDDKAEQFEGYTVGAFCINASSEYKPQVVGRTPTEGKEPSEIYAGCWVRVNMKPFAWGGQKQHKGNNGVSWGLNKVQFIRDDDPFGGGPDAAEVFDDEETGDSEDEEDLVG